jgi:hypothetical protein
MPDEVVENCRLNAQRGRDDVMDMESADQQRHNRKLDGKSQEADHVEDHPTFGSRHLPGKA